MSNQIGYVLVIASANYKQPIFSVLRQRDYRGIAISTNRKKKLIISI